MARRFALVCLVALLALPALAAVNGSKATFFAGYLFPRGTFPYDIGKLGAHFITFDRATSSVSWEVRVGSLQDPARLYVVRNGETPVTIVELVNDPAAFDAEGRSHGRRSIGIDPAVLDDIIAHPSNYAIFINDTQGRLAVRATLLSAYEYEVPVAGHVNGSHGELFVTDLRMYSNATQLIAKGEQVYAMVEYFPSADANSAAAATFITGGPPRATMSLNDVVQNHLRMGGTTGALRVTSGYPLIVASRTYNDQRSAGKGTLGQFVPAEERGKALVSGAMTALSQSSQPLSGYRTNVGFFNPNEAATTISFELRDESGNSLATATMTAGAFAQKQLPLDQLFKDVRFSQENVSIAFTSSQDVFVYASVVDNESTDPYYVEAEKQLEPLP